MSEPLPSLPTRTLTDADVQAIAFQLASLTLGPPNIYLPPKDAVKYLPVFGSAEGIRHAARQGEFKSGAELQKQGGRIGVNPMAYLARKEKEQKRLKVC